MNSWNISPSTDVPSSDQCMNTGYHYNVIVFAYENVLLHICINMLDMEWLEIINMPKIL